MAANPDLRRRDMLGAATALGCLTLAPGIARALARITPTPPQTAGPFYPSPRPLEQDTNLTRLAGHDARAEGRIVQLRGRVLDRDGRPVRGARIELWQANARGRYAHPRDGNPAPLDPNFQGFGVQVTDAQGRYRFTTITPGAYPINPANPDAVRTPHVHFDIAHGQRHLVTQMYFPGEVLNATDRIFQALDPAQQAAATGVVMKTLASGSDADVLQVHWDIVLAT